MTTSPPAWPPWKGRSPSGTEWLIAHHTWTPHAVADGNPRPPRQNSGLREAPDYDDLLLLHDCDVAGRRRGVAVCDVGEALAVIRELDEG